MSKAGKASKSNIIKSSELDVDKIKYSDLKTLDNGAKIIYINYNTDNNPILLQTPECDMPFDAGWFDDTGENCGKFSLKSSIVNDQTFSDKLGEFDKKLTSDAIKKSKEWFKKPKLTQDAVDTMYHNMLSISKDIETGEPNGKYPPQFTFKIVFRDGKCLCKLYDESKTKIEIEPLSGSIEEHQLKKMLVKGAKVKAIIKCNGVWISGNKFGCTWRAEQIIIKVPEELEDCAFRDSDEEDESEGGGEAGDDFIDSDSD